VLYPTGSSNGGSKWSTNTHNKGNTMILKNGGTFIINDSNNN